MTSFLKRDQLAARAVFLSLCLVAASAAIAFASRPEPVPIRQPLAGFPWNIGEWQGREGSGLSENDVALLGVDDYLSRIYSRRGGAPLSLYIGYHASQRQGTAIHSPLNCLPGAGWNPVERSQLSIPVESKVLDVNRIIILKGLDRRIVLYWYQSHGRSIASEYKSRAFMLWDALRTNRTDAALIRIVGRSFTGSSAEAEREVVDFAKSISPFLGQFLPQ